MARSIIQADKECYFCKNTLNLEKHHIFGGYANRKLSEKYGLTVWLCHNCHNEKPWGVHHNIARMSYLHKLAQEEFNKHYPELDFMKIFGRNYL